MRDEYRWRCRCNPAGSNASFGDLVDGLGCEGHPLAVSDGPFHPRWPHIVPSSSSAANRSAGSGHARAVKHAKMLRMLAFAVNASRPCLSFVFGEWENGRRALLS